jgi:hypothetical protein
MQKIPTTSLAGHCGLCVSSDCKHREHTTQHAVISMLCMYVCMLLLLLLLMMMMMYERQSCPTLPSRSTCSECGRIVLLLICSRLCMDFGIILTIFYSLVAEITYYIYIYG